MTISVLQDRQTSTGGGLISSLSLAFSSSLTAGSALHGLGASQTSTNTFSDNNVNTWPAGTLDFIADTVGGENIFHNTEQNVNSGATTVTITFGAVQNFTCLWIREIGGATSTGNPDGHNIVFSASTTSQSISATNANQPALISVLSINSNSQETPVLDASLTASSANPGWDYGTGNKGGVAGHKRITTTGSQSITNTQASADGLVTVMAIFKESGGGAAATTTAWQPIRPMYPPGALPGKLGLFNLLRKGYLSTAQTSGSSGLTFAQTGGLTGAGALAGTSALVFGQTGAVTAAGALAGTSALVFNETGALTGTGALAGESDLVFGQTGTLTQSGLNGSASIVFGQTGALTASGVLAGTSALQFGQTAALTGAGALAGSSALAFSQTGNVSAVGVLAGTSALLFAQTAALTASGALAGSSALTFGASGTADLPAGALAGTSSLSFGGSATLTAFGALIGNCQIIFDAAASTGQVAQAGPVDSPRIAEGHYRRKKKLRKIEQPVSPVFIAPASLESIPQPVIDRVPNFTALSETLGESPAALSARIDREIEFLMRAQAERDDEEAIVWILRALEQLPPD